MKKFFTSIYFNVILSLLASVLAIMQEVWIGSTVPFVNALFMGSFAGIGFAFIAEGIKLLFFGGKFNGKSVLVASILGIIAALVTAIVAL